MMHPDHADLLAASGAFVPKVPDYSQLEAERDYLRWLDTLNAPMEVPEPEEEVCYGNGR